MCGTESLEVVIYDDNGGVPGKALASSILTNLAGFGACCAIPVVKFKKKNAVTVTAGTQYWVVATTAKSPSDLWSVWDFNTTDQINVVPLAINSGSHGETATYLPGPSFAVFGN